MAVVPQKFCIFVAGLTGSDLFYPTNPFGFGLLWPNPVALLSGGFELLRIPVINETGGSSQALDLGLGGPSVGYYGPLMTYLRLNGFGVYEIRQDWRVPLRQDGSRLVELIRKLSSLSVLNPAKVHILCHSRGGLVVRYALGILNDLGELGRIARVVGLGVPHRGSLLAAYNLGGPYEFSLRLQQMSDWFVGNSFGQLTLGNVQQTLRSWPAVYELLPDPVRTWLPAGVAAGLYTAANWAGVPYPPVPAYLTAAAANWSSLPDPPAGVDWVDVAGVGVPTVYTADNTAAIIQRDAEINSSAGDGTVPFPSATQAPRKCISTPTDHSGLPVDPRLWPAILAALNDGLALNVSLPGSVFRTPGG